MKRNAMALVLALCMLLALVPVRASAAQLQPLPEPVLSPMALKELPQPQGNDYSVTMTSTGPGRAELYTPAAAAGESVFFLADPEPGYRVSFDKCGYPKDAADEGVHLYYIGANVYELIMPAGDVVLDLEFVKITTDSHNVKLTASAGGMASVDQKTAKKGESLFIEVVTSPGYTLGSVSGKSGSGTHKCYPLGKVDGAELYEVFMPNEDLEIQVTFQRNGPYAITPYITGNGTVSLSHEKAYELETVTVTARPDRGHEVSSIGCYHSMLTQKSENVWTFSMPKFKEEVHITFVPTVYSISVTTELPMGGTATVDRETGTIGQSVTLTCAPEEGYRVARITGVKDLTDNGDNTYTFQVDNTDVALRVLFLREENPFLDINETHFFYESVLWAVENGITNGVGPDTFGPGTVCNRAQVVTFLWRAAGSPAPESVENPFTDVAEGAWYTDAILWAVEQDITNGVGPDTFGPGTVCNRAQVVTFLWRAAGSPEPSLEENPFADVAQGGWYTDAILWALENGITEGTSATTFSPGSQCFRAQVVTFLHRADQLPDPMPEPEPEPEPVPEPVPEPEPEPIPETE